MFRLQLIFLLFIFTGTGAQVVNRDSLLNLLGGASDKKKLEINQELAEAYKYTNTDSALFFATRALELSRKINDQYQAANSNRQIGKIYMDVYQYEKAIPYFTRARELYHNLKKDKEEAEVYNELGLLYYQQEYYEQALGYTQEALEIGRALDDEEIIAYSLGNLADINFRQNKIDQALDYYMQTLELYEELGDEEDISNILNRIGNFYSSRADFENAIEYYLRVLEIRRRSGNKKSIGIVLNNIGNQYLQLGNFDLAIENYQEASEIFKEIDFDLGIAATLTGMAVIYEHLKQFDAVLEVYKEVLAIREKMGNKRELANTLSNIAVTYSHMLADSLESLYGLNYQDSIFIKGTAPDIEYGRESVNYNLRALEYRMELGDYQGLSIALSNLGNVYQYLGDYDKSREYFNRWLELPEESHDDDTKAAVRIGLGKVAMYEGNYNTAIVYFNQALRLAEQINKKIYIQITSENLSELNEKEGNYREALRYFKRYHNVYDSLNQERTRDQIHEMQVKYETEAKEQENELLRKEQEISETKLKNSRRALIATVIVVLIFIGLVIQLIRQNALRRKANLELARKNRLITEQTKEITDSIQYASRIQNAILPPEEILSQFLPDHFIIYRPRDIVSGDYFWITEKEDKIITIVADCTGHGVPGAFMSMLGVAFLNEIVSKHDEVHVDFILNELRTQVIDSLHQTGREGENQDGMDVALFIINKKTMDLEFAGANNPLLIFRGEEMIELKADKMPIGIHTKAGIPFNRKDFKLKKGDMLYAFSDGYPDQFGGPDGKKFMIKNFKKLLSQVHAKSLKEQKKLLDKSLDDWMKNTKQIDDIIVMGVRV